MSSPADASNDVDGRGNRLRTTLASRGYDMHVDVDGALAILRCTATADRPSLDRDARSDIVSLARECGFTHVALELVDDGSDRV